MATDWISAPCLASTARWRFWEDGRIEVAGSGFPTRKGGWPASIERWRPEITAAAAREQISPHYPAAIMLVESGGDPNACSPCSACPGLKDCADCCAFGLMQLIRSTAATVAAELGLRAPSGTDLRQDPALNIALGTHYLATLLRRYGGDFVQAAVAYNAGSARCCGASAVCLTHPSLYTYGFVTDGSDYARQAVENVNTAVAAGFPTVWNPIDLRPLVPRPFGEPSPFGQLVAFLGAASLALWVTRDWFAPGGIAAPWAPAPRRA